MVRSLTMIQKLHALSARFYSDIQWKPKAGDLYTTSRADLELYEIADIKDGCVFTRPLSHFSLALTKWDEETFLTEGFGPRRVWVPEWVMGTEA